MNKQVTLTAHRGYRQQFAENKLLPENTMFAFREALKLDIDSIEMDVHMTKDHNIIVMHDADMSRTTDTKGKICDKTLEEVRAADAGIKFDERFKGEKVPLLEEFLELMATRPDIKILLELKDYPEEMGTFAYASCEKTLNMCRQYGIWGKNRLTIITFSVGLCSWIRARHGDQVGLHGFWPAYSMRGWETDNPYKYLDEVCLFNHIRTLDNQPVPADTPVVDKKYFEEFAAMGIKPCVYFSMNCNPADYKLAYEYGALGFTCDDPYTCGKILDELGARKLK
jgi:glycerophosphodiester phosphodiesterase